MKPNIQPYLTTSLLLILSALYPGCGEESSEHRPAPDTSRPAQTTQHEEGYRVEPVRNGGIVTGRVTIAEIPADLPDFDEAEVQGVCLGALDNNRLEVGPDGGVAWGVVRIEGIEAGKPFREGIPMVDQVGCRYLPHVVTVPVGRSVRFRNSDPTAHNVRVEEQNGLILMNATQGTQGDVDEMQVGSAGPKLIGCDYHPWMNAYVVGIETPYAAVTGPDGRFEITDVPPGEYRLHLWVNGFIPEPRLDNNGRLVRYRYSPAHEMTRTIRVESSGRVEEEFFVLTSGETP